MDGSRQGALEELELETAGGARSRIVVGPGALDRAAELGVPSPGPGDSPTEIGALLADEHVLALHGSRLPDPWRRAVVRLPRGEAAKTWDVLGRTLEQLVERQVDRGAALAVLGGGAATDLGGLAAALYLRGIPYVACPSSLLAMVDASVGGKTAVNLGPAKNLVGAFWQPARVLADTRLLATLDDDQLRSGLGEVLKTALLAGEPLLTRLETGAEALLARDAAASAEVVAACIRLKAAVVAEDEREAGRRAVLNLGHTVGHAIEAVAGIGTLPHGVCVAAGIGAALDLARRTGHLDDPELPERVARLAERLGLPPSLDALRAARGAALEPSALRRAIDLDKKRAGGRPRFVLPRRAGAVEHGVEVDEGALAATLAG